MTTDDRVYKPDSAPNGGTINNRTYDDSHIRIPSSEKGSVEIDPTSNTIKIGDGKGGGVSIDIADAKDGHYGFELNAGVITWDYRTDGSGTVGLNLGAGSGEIIREGSTVKEINFHYGIHKFGVEGNLEISYKNQGNGDWLGVLSVNGPLGFHQELATFKNHFPQNINELSDLVKDDFVALYFVKELEGKQNSILQDMIDGKSKGELVYPFGPRSGLEHSPVGTDKVAALLASNTLTTDETLIFAEKLAQLQEKTQSLPANLQYMFRDNFCDQFVKEAQAGVYNASQPLAAASPAHSNFNNLTAQPLQTVTTATQDKPDQTQTASVVNAPHDHPLTPEAKQTIATSAQDKPHENHHASVENVPNQPLDNHSSSFQRISGEGFPKLQNLLSVAYLSDNQKDNLSFFADQYMNRKEFKAYNPEEQQYWMGQFTERYGELINQGKFQVPVEVNIKIHEQNVAQAAQEQAMQQAHLTSQNNDVQVRSIERS